MYLYTSLIILLMKRTQIYIPEYLQQKLETLSKNRGSSKSAIIRDAVVQYLERQSDSERKNKLRMGAGMWKKKRYSRYRETP